MDERWILYSEIQQNLSLWKLLVLMDTLFITFKLKLLPIFDLDLNLVWHEALIEVVINGHSAVVEVIISVTVSVETCLYLCAVTSGSLW